MKQFIQLAQYYVKDNIAIALIIKKNPRYAMHNGDIYLKAKLANFSSHPCRPYQEHHDCELLPS
jgi:hypothetical protein